MFALDQNDPSRDYLECGHVRISAELLAETDERGRAVTRVPRTPEDRVSLQYGFLAPRPVLLAIFGVVILTIGLAPIPMLIFWFRQGGTIWDWQILMVLGTLLGGWVLYEACKRGFYLAVHSPKLKAKLAFGKGISRAQIVLFLRDVEERYDLVVGLS